MPSARALGFWWGALVSVIPLTDFLARPPRVDLAEYSFNLIREAPQIVLILVPTFLILSGVPVLLAAWRCEIDFRRAGFYPTLVLYNLLVMAASLLGLEASALVYLVLLPYCLALSTALSALASDADEVVRGFLSAVAIGIGAAMVLMTLDANYSYGRLMGRSGPNYWGMNALVAFFAALALRNMLVKVAIASFAAVVVYLCQSRGSMMAMAGGAGVVWLLFVYHGTRLQRLLLVIGTAVVVIAACIFLSDLILAKLLLVQDRSRGAESGGTGRFAAWVQALELFAQSPWFGVGYRQHEKYITAASSAHNAYLASLADTGLFGFVGYLGLMLGGAVMAVRKAILVPGRIRFAVAGLTVSFLMVGLVERVGLATGNALSLVMIYVSAWAFRIEGGFSLARVPDHS